MDGEILLSKFKGSMVGTATGDSVGAGFEGMSNFTTEQVMEVAEKRNVLRYTDDTHMMIGVAESLIAREGFDGEHMASRFIYNFNREPFRGYGPGPPRIFALIESGEAWNRASAMLYPGGSYGNGSAMRVAPVGLLYHDKPEKLKDVACQSSQITHAHILGREGAALQAYAVSLATTSEPSVALDREDFLAKLIDSVSEEVYHEKLKKMSSLLRRPDKKRVIAELGNGIEAFTAVPASIFSFLCFPDSFEEAVLYAIGLGGDTDTIGAMTGAISGARLGLDAIPYNWRYKLENRFYIEPLAEELWELKFREF